MAISMRLLLLLLLAAPFRVWADGSPADTEPRRPTDQSSANFNKTQRFIPGEEVITPTGKKVKVWSSEGPVPVSRAPEPFEDREKSLIPDNVIIDAGTVPALRDDHRRHDQVPNASAHNPQRAPSAPRPRVQQNERH